MVGIAFCFSLSLFKLSQNTFKKVKQKELAELQTVERIVASGCSG